MKLKYLLLLSLPIFTLSITSCGKGNDGEDDGGGGGASKGKTLPTGVKIETAMDQEAYDFFKAFTGRDPEKKEFSGDIYGYGVVNLEINFKTKYKSHEALLKDAMKCLDDTKYDLSIYKEKGFDFFRKVTSVYSDAYTQQINTIMDGSYTGRNQRIDVQSIHVATDNDKDKFKSTHIDNKGNVTYSYPDIGDYIFTARFTNYSV